MTHKTADMTEGTDAPTGEIDQPTGEADVLMRETAALTDGTVRLIDEPGAPSGGPGVASDRTGFWSFVRLRSPGGEGGDGANSSTRQNAITLSSAMTKCRTRAQKGARIRFGCARTHNTARCGMASGGHLT
eukprot:scaffold179163_cov40-Tisochrysis_lutea.AAC.2